MYLNGFVISEGCGFVISEGYLSADEGDTVTKTKLTRIHRKKVASKIECISLIINSHLKEKQKLNFLKFAHILYCVNFL